MYAWVLLAALAAVALADWFAVATQRRGVEQVAKPAYVVLLGAFAWLLHAGRDGLRTVAPHGAGTVPRG